MSKIGEDEVKRLELRRQFADRIAPIQIDILEEIVRGQLLHGDVLSLREGWGILQEEMDELWDAIKANDEDAVSEESVHVAAVALRIVLDVVESNYKR